MIHKVSMMHSMTVDFKSGFYFISPGEERFILSEKKLGCDRFNRAHCQSLKCHAKRRCKNGKVDSRQRGPSNVSKLVGHTGAPKLTHNSDNLVHGVCGNKSRGSAPSSTGSNCIQVHLLMKSQTKPDVPVSESDLVCVTTNAIVIHHPALMINKIRTTD